MRPGGKSWLLVLAVAAAAFLAAAGVAYARFTDAPSVAGNSFTLDTLNAPTSVTASGGASSVTLNWTATSDTYAGGHRVFRGTASGGPYAQIAEVTPRTTTSYVDNPSPAGTYFYVVRAYYQNWESANSNQTSNTLTTSLANCGANAAVTSGSGDNNGFELNPGNACADDAAFAEDTNSGTGTPDTCTSANKDRHLFYNYGFAIPAGSTINGIEARLDAWADVASFSPFMCVDLSWDGGTTWTATQTTPTLTTSQTTFVLGATSDTWGRTWGVADFSNANFRLRVTNVSGFNGRDFFLDWAAVRVTYTPP